MKFLVKSVRHNRALRVHIAGQEEGKSNFDRPLCGGGNGGKSIHAWQMDLGPANCQRCAQLQTRNPKPKTKTDEHPQHA